MPELPEVMRTFSGAGPMWRYYLLMGLGFTLGVLRVIYGRHLRSVWQLIKRYNLGNQICRERDEEVTVPQALLTIYHIGVVALLFYGIFDSGLLVGELSGTAFWFMLAAVVAMMTVRLFLQIAMGWVFKIQDELQLYRFHMNQIGRGITVALFPLVLIAMAGPSEWRLPVICISLVICALGMILAWVRGIRIFQSHIKPTGFRFLLYLCTLEIVPYICLAKAMLDFFEPL